MVGAPARFASGASRDTVGIGAKERRAPTRVERAILPCRSRRTRASLYNRSSIPPWPRRPRSPARRLFVGRLAALALALAPRAPCARADAGAPVLLVVGDSISAALRPAAGHRLGRPARGAARRATAIRTASSTRASPATRRPAAARACRRCSRAQAGDRRPRAGRQRRAARRQPRVDAREPRRDGRRRRRAPARRRCSSACRLPPNYGAAYVREFDALFADVAKARKVPLVPFFFEGFGERNEHVPARPHPPDGGGAAAAARQRLAGAAAAARIAAMIDGAARAAATARSTIDALGDYRRAHRRAQPVRVRRRPHARRGEPPGARRRRARAHRHAARAGLGVRRAGAPARRSSRATSRRCSRRVRRQAARLGAARLLLARRPAQPLARAHAERDRLARRAARRRLSRLPAARRRASSRRCRRAFATRSSAGSPAPARAGCSPRSPPRARRCSTSKRWRGIAARCWATCPTIRSRRRSAFDSQLLAALAALRSGASGVRRVGEQARSARCRCPTRCSPRCAPPQCIRVDTPQPLRVALLKDEYAHFLADHGALAARLAHLVPLHGKKTIERWTDAAQAGDWDTLVGELLALHYDPTYTRSIGGTFPRVAERHRRRAVGARPTRRSARSRASSTRAVDARADPA